MENERKPRLTKTRRSLPISLLRTRELIMEDIRPMLKRHGVTEQQWRVLRVISEHPEPMDASTIAERACLLPPSLTRILRTLTEHNWIETFKDETDGRRSLTSITTKGQALIDEVTPESMELFARLRAIVGEKRWEELVNLLSDIRDDINRARKNTSENE